VGQINWIVWRMGVARYQDHVDARTCEEWVTAPAPGWHISTASGAIRRWPSGRIKFTWGKDANDLSSADGFVPVANPRPYANNHTLNVHPSQFWGLREAPTPRREQ
jgi:hypothetical protein